MNHAISHRFLSSIGAAAAVSAGILMSGCPGSVPGAPMILESLPASPANENYPRLRGETEADTLVRIYTDSECAGTSIALGPADSFGLPGTGGAGGPAGVETYVEDDSTVTFYATAEYPGGEASECSEGFTYTEDSTAPAAPAWTGTEPPSPSNHNQPLLSGLTEPRALVRVFRVAGCPGDPVAETRADENGGFSVEVMVEDDAVHAFYARAVDAAGNVSECTSTPLLYEEDSTAPAGEVTFTGSDPLSPSRSLEARITGSADPEHWVRLYADPACSGPVLAEGDAADFASPGLAVGVEADTVTAIHATQEEPAGNESACSTASITYVNDRTAPETPEVVVETPGNDNGPRVWVTSEPEATARVYQSEDCSGSAETGLVPAGGQVLVKGQYVADNQSAEYSVDVVDPAGNVSPCAGPFLFVEDSIPPAAPVLSGTTPASPGYETRPWINGTSPGNGAGTIRIAASYTHPDYACWYSHPGGLRGAGLVTKPGEIFSEDFTVQIDPAFPTGITYYIGARAYDRAGNASECSETVLEYRALRP